MNLRKKENAYAVLEALAGLRPMMNEEEKESQLNYLKREKSVR